MRDIQAAVWHQGHVVQPLVFETDIPYAPYSQAGTVFLVGRWGRVWVITCRHALRPDNLGPVCVFPADGARAFLPLRNVHYVSVDIIPDDYTDIALIEVNQSALRPRKHGRAQFFELDRQLPDWRRYQNVTDFVVIGYPTNRSYVDYDDSLIHSERVALYGRYSGPAKSAHIFTLEIGDPKGLDTFNGFSGSPVFCWVRRLGAEPTLTLAGMVIQGTVQSRLMHFIEASIIFDASEVWGAQATVPPNPSLERTSTGKPLGPRGGSGHHPARGPSGFPVGSAQLKR